ncbi:MAG: hypothetical protein KGV44_03415 [Flavobacteriaceae bacterium]|nr:hypothetical protein [Flavobacteriaceae bacterium]
MENPFSNILTNEKVPEILREKVINDIAFVKLSLDVADLFAIKCPSVVREFIDTEKETKNNPKTIKK